MCACTNPHTTHLSDFGWDPDSETHGVVVCAQGGVGQYHRNMDPHKHHDEHPLNQWEKDETPEERDTRLQWERDAAIATHDDLRLNVETMKDAFHSANVAAEEIARASDKAHAQQRATDRSIHAQEMQMMQQRVDTAREATMRANAMVTRGGMGNKSDKDTIERLRAARADDDRRAIQLRNARAGDERRVAHQRENLQRDFARVKDAERHAREGLNTMTRDGQKKTREIAGLTSMLHDARESVLRLTKEADKHKADLDTAKLSLEYAVAKNKAMTTAATNHSEDCAAIRAECEQRALQVAAEVTVEKEEAIAKDEREKKIIDEKYNAFRAKYEGPTLQITADAAAKKTAAIVTKANAEARAAVIVERKKLQAVRRKNRDIKRREAKKSMLAAAKIVNPAPPTAVKRVHQKARKCPRSRRVPVMRPVGACVCFLCMRAYTHVHTCAEIVKGIVSSTIAQPTIEGRLADPPHATPGEMIYHALDTDYSSGDEIFEEYPVMPPPPSAVTTDVTPNTSEYESDGECTLAQVTHATKRHATTAGDAGQGAEDDTHKKRK